MAHYYDDPSCLVLDARLEIRSNIEHILSDNKDRFPEPYKSISDFALQNLLKGAIDSARERVARNYKVAIPQYYKGKVQLLLPLCLSDPRKADLAIVVARYDQLSEDGAKKESFYRASTCLTLDMAYKTISSA